MTSDCEAIEAVLPGRTGVTSETLSGIDATGAPVLAFATLMVVVVVPGGRVAGPTTAVMVTPFGGRVPVAGVTETTPGLVEVAVYGAFGGGATGTTASAVTSFFAPGVGKLSEPGMKTPRITWSASPYGRVMWSGRSVGFCNGVRPPRVGC